MTRPQSPHLEKEDNSCPGYFIQLTEGSNSNMHSKVFCNVKDHALGNSHPCPLNWVTHNTSSLMLFNQGWRNPPFASYCSVKGLSSTWVWAISSLALPLFLSRMMLTLINYKTGYPVTQLDYIELSKIIELDLVRMRNA